MIVGFFHDHNFVCNAGNVYTTGTLNSVFWSRYLNLSIKKLIVCARESKVDSVENLALASTDKVNFVFSPNLSTLGSLVYNKNKEIVKDTVKKVDVVICRLPSEIGFAAVAEAKKQGKTVICEVVACPFDALSFYGSLQAKIYANLIKLRMKKWVSRCDGALYVTENELQSRYPCKGFTANASNVELAHIDYSSMSYREERFEKRREKGKLKFGIIGTLQNDTKGIDIAIKAMKGLPASLHVIGSGDPIRYQKLASDISVSFFYDGFLASKAEVFEWLKDIDVYLQPSFQEGLPRATIEAMSVGCPVLSSNAGGLEELVRGEYVHSRGDINKLKKDLNQIINNYDLSLDTKRSLDVASKYLFEVLKVKRSDFYSKFILKVK